jgi:hypothetical protein
MAVAGIQLNINTDELRSLRDNIRAFFPKADAAEKLGDAIEKAIWPAYLRLREVTPVGPTGNLKRAAAQKVIKYKNTGVAVGLIGYKRAASDPSQATEGTVRIGPDRGFHQWWLEFGTKDRTIPGKRSKGKQPRAREYTRRSPTTPYTRTRRWRDKVITETVRGKGVVQNIRESVPTYIASSFIKRGPFEFENGRPDSPNAFFKKSKNPITIRPMPVGGDSGQPPVQTAFMQTQAQMAEILQRELSLTLAEAWSALRFRDSGSITGTDTLGPG